MAAQQRGGVMSAPLFNNVGSENADSVPDRPNLEGIIYADDVDVIISGDNEIEMATYMQEALDIQSQWADSHGLKFSIDKTKVMLFTRKYKNFVRPELKLDGKVIQYVDTFKYLGVTLDTKLSWKPHVKEQVKRAKASLMIGKRMLGKRWGLSPMITSWLYTAIVRPMLTYGSVVWINCLAKKGLVDELRKVQRLGLKMITGCMHSTPTAGMETLLGIPPIEDTLKASALASCVRLHTTNQWKDKAGTTEFRSHVQTLNEIKKAIPELNFPQDRSTFKMRTVNLFTTRIGNRQEMTNSKIRPMPFDPGKINVFTDGSKNEIGSGAAYILKGHSIELQEYFNLGEYATVFQAEIFAINTASLALLEVQIVDQIINFYIDSRSAIMALESYTVKDKSVEECKRHLNKLVEYGNKVRLNWIPGHSDQKGNEIADRLAKRGVELEVDGITPRIPISKCVITKAIKDWTAREHDKRWQNRTDCRQTKLVLPSTTHGWSRHILKRDRDDIRLLTQLVTGHANLQYHRFVMGLEDNDKCDKCGDRQSAVHVLAECPEYIGLRMNIFGRPILYMDEIRTYSIDKVLKFARLSEFTNY